MILFTGGTVVVKFIDNRKQHGVCLGLGEGGDLVFNGYKVSILQDEKCSVDRWWGDSCNKVWTYLMPLNCTVKND